MYNSVGLVMFYGISIFHLMPNPVYTGYVNESFVVNIFKQVSSHFIAHNSIVSSIVI